MFPVFSAIYRLINAVAERYVTAKKRLAGSCPNDIVAGWSDGNRTDGLCILAIEHRVPVVSPIERLPHSAGGCPGVIDIPIARYANHRCHTISRRPDIAKTQGAIGSRRDRLAVCGFLLRVGDGTS